MKTYFTYLIFILLPYLVFSNEKTKDKLETHDWHAPYSKYIEWEEGIHSNRIILVPTKRLAEAQDLLRKRPFVEMNLDEVKWVLDDDNFNPTNILSGIIQDYIRESQKEEISARTLRSLKSTSQALKAEHQALIYRRRADELKKMAFKPKCFLMRGLTTGYDMFKSSRFKFCYNYDILGMLLEYSTNDEIDWKEVNAQPVIVILREVFPKVYVNIKQEL